jgi:hypothetical protein
MIYTVWRRDRDSKIALLSTILESTENRVSAAAGAGFVAIATFRIAHLDSLWLQQKLVEKCNRSATRTQEERLDPLRPPSSAESLLSG